MQKLVLLHGAIGAADQLEPLKEQLSGHYEVHLLEFDGHGKSATSNVPFTLSHLKEQLAALLEKVGEAHVFGYSMGGFVALMLAADGNSKIRSITTLGTKMKWSPEIASKETKQLDAEKIKQKVPKFFEALARRHGEDWIDVLHRTSAFIEALGKDDPMTKEAMEAVTCPVQLLLADGDQMVSQEETKQVHAWLPNAKYTLLKESKHPIEKVDLDLLSKSIINFHRV